MKTGDFEKVQSFEVVMNPNLRGITKEDLDEQFDLADQIMKKTSPANEAVIRIREIKSHIDTNKEKLSASDVKRTGTPFLEKRSAIEQELYQVRNQSSQDPLNFPVKLNNRLASLRRSMENGEAKPTNGAYQVFKELSIALDQHLGNLKTVMEAHLPKVNSALKNTGVEEILASE